MAFPDDVTDAYAYVIIGFRIRSCLWTSSTECRWVIDNVDKLMKCLDSFSFTYPRNELNGLRQALEQQQTDSGGTSLVEKALSDKLRSVVECVHDTVRSQAQDRRLVHLQVGAVSQKLQDLAKTHPLNVRQTYLFQETSRCLETGAFRSAIVMGWNLLYDMIRQWVFADKTKLGAFNGELAKIQDKSGKPKYIAIADYTDFFDKDAPGEKVVLDVCKDANLIGGNLYDDLRGYLRQRNTYAHATDSQPTVNQANAFLDHLVDVIAKLP